MVYVPLAVFGATVKFPSISTLNGPEATGVTSVFSIVTGAPFNVSFVNTLPPVDGMVSSLATSGFNTTTEAIAVSQLVEFEPTSHN